MAVFQCAFKTHKNAVSGNTPLMSKSLLALRVMALCLYIKSNTAALHTDQGGSVVNGHLTIHIFHS